MSLQIRESHYRGTAGFTVSGHLPDGSYRCIFTETRESAVKIKRKVTNGLEVTPDDFGPLPDSATSLEKNI